MSSALRLSIIMVLLLATAALGLIAYNTYLPKPVMQVAQNAPAPVTIGYFVAAHPLPVGTLAREEDFEVRSAPSGGAPSGAIPDTPDAKAGLRGSLVRRFLDTGAAVTSEDVLRPRDRGFLASVLAPDTRAVSIKVDAESGVSGLIWPGDLVDVVLTQVSDKADQAHRSLSEVVLHNVRIIAIDQDIVQGAKDNKDNNAAAGKATQTVSLQLASEQVKKVAVAKELGKLSLAIRAAVEQQETADAGTMFGCDVSQEIARQSAIASESAMVVVYTGEKAKEYSVKKHDAVDMGAKAGCNVSSPEVARQTAAVVSLTGDKAKE
jgi:pilus assembly protein CpaB